MWKHYYILKLNLKKLNVKNKYENDQVQEKEKEID